MANSHPYISGAGNISQIISQFRKAFPATVTSETIKKLGIAPKNESHVINVLQFIGVIDAEGKRTEEAHSVFALGDDDFAKGFEPIVKNAYSTLFELHGDAAWEESDERLTTFFRQTDRTSDAIGRRQTAVFKVLAALAGHGEITNAKSVKVSKKNPTASKAKSSDGSSKSTVKVKPNLDSDTKVEPSRQFGLSVRIEVNLPSGGTKQTYDDIFKSIRENLIDG